MSTRAAWLLCGILLVGVCTVLAVITPVGPPQVQIMPPSPDLAPGLARLSGVWEASQGRPGQLVVERINETRAVIVHFWADQLPGHPSGGWERVVARVQRDGTIQWGYPVHFTLRLADGVATLESEAERAGAVARTTFKKVETLASPGRPTLQATLTKAVHQPGEEVGR